MVTCPNCEGYGEVQHPRWGSRNCPEPTIECPWCHGKCEVTENTAEAFNLEQLDRDWQAALAARNQPTTDPNDPEEPF